MGVGKLTVEVNCLDWFLPGAEGISSAKQRRPPNILEERKNAKEVCGSW